MRTVFLINVIVNGKTDVLAFESKTARNIAYSDLMRMATDEREAGADERETGAEIVITKGEVETEIGRRYPWRWSRVKVPTTPFCQVQKYLFRDVEKV